MLEKEFVTYEIAKELKDLGFDEECLMLYYQNGNILFADVFSFRDPFKEIEFKVITSCE